MAQVPLAGTNYTVGVDELSQDRMSGVCTMAGKSSKNGKGDKPGKTPRAKSDVDKFLKDATGLDTAREKEIGQHIGYRYDVNLLPDYNRLTPFLKDYMEFMGWDDLNWLEDVHMGYEEGRAGDLRSQHQRLGAVPKNDEAAGQPAGPRHDGARAADQFQMSPIIR